MGKNAIVSALPLKEAGWILGKRFFRTYLDMREGKEPLGLEKYCDGCGKDFSAAHALDCDKGGLVHRRHEGLVKYVAVESDKWFSGVTTKFRLTEVTGEEMMYKSAKTKDGSVPDVRVPGLFESCRAAYLDGWVTNTTSSTAIKTTVDQHLKNCEQTKRRFYVERCNEVEHSDFAPIVTSHLGTCGPAAENWVRRVAAAQCTSLRELSWRVNALRVGLQFAVVRGMCECLWGSRKRVKGAKGPGGLSAAGAADPEGLLVAAGLGTLDD